MERYWDLDKKQRSELTYEQIDTYVTIELMEQGVVHPAEPKYAIIEDLPEPDIVMYGVKSAYSTSSFGFASPEDAANFCRNSLKIESHYVDGSYLYTASKEPAEIEPLKIYSEEMYSRNRSAIERNAAAKKANQELKETYDKQVEKAKRVSDRIIEDYRECRNLQWSYQQVVDTYNDYLGNCDGVEKQSFFFLGKVYDAPTIYDAFEWFGLNHPVIQESPVTVADEVAVDAQV